MAQSKKAEKKRHVVVVARMPGTSWARVVGGDLVSKQDCPDGTQVVVLAEARQALFYARESGGELGLAFNGPRGESRVTGPVPSLEIAGVTLLAESTETAAGTWRAAPTWWGEK